MKKEKKLKEETIEKALQEIIQKEEDMSNSDFINYLLETSIKYVTMAMEQDQKVNNVLMALGHLNVAIRRLKETN